MSKQSRKFPTTALVALAFGVFGVLLSRSSAQEAAVQVPDEDCLACHESMDKTLSHSPHRLSSEVANSKVTMSCVSCHSGASVHVEDPSVENIGNPARQSAQEVNALCETCHRAHRELDNVGFDPHAQFGVSCVSCHSVHANQPGLLVDQQTKFCGRCHEAVSSQFSKTSTHPVNEGQVTCLSCHDFTGKKQPQFGAGAQENCIACHTAQAGPFPWPHEAASSYNPGGEGCISCHNPHGSANDRLLVRTGDGLCTQCHGVPALHKTQHAGIGSQFACIECHTDVHGSDHNRGLLDADLGAKIGGTPASCYCHDAN